MNQHEAMQFAEQFYYSPAMKRALARLSGEWQTSKELDATWGALQTLTVRDFAERRVNPGSVAGVDYYQWRRAERNEEERDKENI